MAPKKAGSAAPKKAASAPAHGSYQDMIRNAIIQLKDRSGSSRQALKKYVLANNKLGDVSDAAFTSRFNKALAAGSESGVFLRPKGASGPVKLAKSGAAKTEGAAVKKAPSADKKPAAAKKASTTKAPAAKKASATKANTSKVRKSPTKGDGVQKVETVSGKSKSGRPTKTRVTKDTKKPAAAKKAKAAPKAKATKAAA